MSNDPVPRDPRSHDPLRRPCRGRSRLLRLPARRAHRHRRAERGGQDDLFQPDVRPARRLRRRRADRGPGRHRLERAPADAARPRAGVPAHQPVSPPQRRRERAARDPGQGRGSLRHAPAVAGERRSHRPRRRRPRFGRPPRQARRARVRSAARRSAQARSGDDDGARALNLHVRRADRRHERR